MDEFRWSIIVANWKQARSNYYETNFPKILSEIEEEFITALKESAKNAENYCLFEKEYPINCKCHQKSKRDLKTHFKGYGGNHVPACFKCNHCEGIFKIIDTIYKELNVKFNLDLLHGGVQRNERGIEITLLKKIG